MAEWVIVPKGEDAYLGVGEWSKVGRVLMSVESFQQA